jgi:hypothetical protein
MILAGLLPAVQAAQVWFDDAGDLSSWDVSEKTPGEYVTVESTWAGVDGNGLEFFLSSWNEAATDNGSWTDIWKDAGVTIEAEKEYTFTAKIASWDSGLEGDEQGIQPPGAGDQVYIAMWDSVSWDYIAEGYIWPDNAAPGNDAEYVNYSVSFDTYGGNNAAYVGNTVGVEIGSSGDQWWNSFSVSEMSIDVVPEPATLGLVGVFGVGMFFARRHLKA